MMTFAEQQGRGAKDEIEREGGRKSGWNEMQWNR